MRKEILFGLVFVFLIGIVSAVEIPSYQNKYVNDFVGVLSEMQKAELMAVFGLVDENTTAEITFVSMATINGSDLSQYALELGRQWGVGKKDKNNGLVILYVKDVNKIYVATGYGLEGILPDGKVGRILDEYYVPMRDVGNVSIGIVDSGKALAQVVFDNADEVRSGQASGASSGSNYGFYGVIIGGVLFIAIFAYILSSRKKEKGFLDFWDFFFADFVARILVSILLGGKNRSGGGGGFGGGGGGFGGGGFGGGGAGR